MSKSVCAKVSSAKIGNGYEIKGKETLVDILSRRGFPEEASEITNTIYSNLYPEFYNDNDKDSLRVAPDYLFIHLAEGGLELSLHGPSPIHGLPYRAIAGTFRVRKADGSVKITKREHNGENVLKR